MFTELCPWIGLWVCVDDNLLLHYSNGVYNTNTWLLQFNVMFIVLITTALEEPGGGQDGGCVDEVTQQTLSK